MGIGIMLTSVFFIRLRHSTKGIGTDMATPTSKPRKYRFSFEIQPPYWRYVTWTSTRNTSWAWAQDWWTQRGRAPELRMYWYTYALCAGHDWRMSCIRRGVDV